jgi:RNA recognition motif-containing protein
MNNKLFVGGLSWSTTQESLQTFFSQVGTVVEAKVIMDRATGRSRGFGFVTMSSPEEAQKAVDELNNKELDGRAIKVSEAIEKKN